MLCKYNTKYNQQTTKEENKRWKLYENKSKKITIQNKENSLKLHIKK